MLGKKYENKPEQAAWRFQPDARRKADSLLAIRQAVHEKRIRRRPTFAENIWNQLRFQTWQHWALSGGLLLVTMLFALHVGGNETDAVNAITVCSVFLVFAGNICLSSIAHLFSWHMAELEKTLYLDLKQMVCIRMLEAGVFDLLMLGILTGCSESRAKTGILIYLMYLLVPFLWSEIFYLHMLIHVRSVFTSFRQLSLGMLCGMLAVFPVFWENAYLPETLPVWGVLFVAGIVLFSVEIYSMLRKIDTGECICQTS